LSDLKAAFENMEAVRDDPKAVLKGKVAYYEALLAAAHNPQLAHYFMRLNRRITQLRILSFSVDGRVEKSINELREIVNTIQLKDADRAQSLCVQHVRAAAQAAQTALSSHDELGGMAVYPG
jgi:DNA-binding FadR family transcriptional regulator